MNTSGIIYSYDFVEIAHPRNIFFPNGSKWVFQSLHIKLNDFNSHVDGWLDAGCPKVPWLDRFHDENVRVSVQECPNQITM